MTRVRPATEDDYPAVRALERQLLQAHVAGIPDGFDPTASDFTERSFARLIDRPWSTVLVVDLDGAVVAYAAIRIETASRVARITARLPRRLGTVVETVLRSVTRLRPGRSSPIVARPVAFVDSFAVDAAVRRQRLAETLWAACVVWAEEQGAPDIQCEVFDFNVAVLGLVEHLGLTLYKRRYRYVLSGSPAVPARRPA